MGIGILGQGQSDGAHRRRDVRDPQFSRPLRPAQPIAAGGEGDASEVVERAEHVAGQLPDASAGPAGGGLAA
jgi:hypothetical protein